MCEPLKETIIHYTALNAVDAPLSLCQRCPLAPLLSRLLLLLLLQIVSLIIGITKARLYVYSVG